ncbi:hypothetical protein B9Z65_3000 [Elsinoe australis]|uniref:AB hydrolase-1 domain-containing protein n=1 Tax=Elsinoe australis TaxID=40998 RepID=A0A2P7ZU55_9PEZI|nr:hypothetical protein B9Z65_3000 [Elsinoe australis]
MVIRSKNEWESSDISKAVNIGTHKLHVSTSGPPRRLAEPVIIFFSGGGVPCYTYIRLQRLLSEHYRVYFHDRAGYEQSERGPYMATTAQINAEELEKLLSQIQVVPPYILVGHSYGGIVARAFLQRYQDRPGAIRGLVLADAATELMYQVFTRTPDPALETIAKGVDFAELTDLRRESKLTDDEWRAALEAIERTQPGARLEDTHGGGLELARSVQGQRHVLEPWPLSVVRCNMARDFQLIFEEGVKRGNGSREEKEQARSYIDRVIMFLDDIAAAQLRLSSCHRFVTLDDRGHDDILRRPEVYVNEVQWIMNMQHLVAGL